MSLDHNVSFALLAIFAVQALPAHAEDTGWHQPEMVYSWTAGSVQIWLEGEGSQNHVCANQTYPRRYLLREAVAGFEEKFALATAALAGGMQLNIRYECENDSPYVKAIRARPG